MDESLLNVKNLDVDYGNDIQVIWDLKFSLLKGQITSMVGLNGAGKTTTIKAIYGFLKPKKGRITFGDVDITGWDTPSLVQLGMVCIPEGRQLFPQMSVKENLLLGAYPKKFRDGQKERMEWILTLFPRLKERLDQKAGSMSGGEQQMLAIGRGLMAKPLLLMVDELSLGLAPILLKELFGTIKSINEEGMTIFLVEQNVKSALEISHKALVIENGRITTTGNARDILEDDYIRTTYLGQGLGGAGSRGGRGLDSGTQQRT